MAGFFLTPVSSMAMWASVTTAFLVRAYCDGPCLPFLAQLCLTVPRRIQE